MSHICRLSTPQVSLHAVGTPVIIRNQSLFDDFVRLANLYQMAFPDFEDKVIINSYDSAVDAALTFFCMVEDQYFPLEHMWDWDDCYENYEGTIRRWLRQIPVRVVGHDQELQPMRMTEPKALLTRLSKVGNYSDTATKHKKVLRYQYPEWGWDVLSEFSLSRVIETLDEMILPPPFDKLPALVRYITGESNTYFLDYTLLIGRTTSCGMNSILAG